MSLSMYHIRNFEKGCQKTRSGIFGFQENVHAVSIDWLYPVNQNREQRAVIVVDQPFPTALPRWLQNVSSSPQVGEHLSRAGREVFDVFGRCARPVGRAAPMAHHR
ncbi:hypothetical protein AB0M34_08650 [Nocardia sp. NPDC050193]